jgi:hypothetical protein
VGMGMDMGIEKDSGTASGTGRGTTVEMETANSKPCNRDVEAQSSTPKPAQSCHSHHLLNSAIESGALPRPSLQLLQPLPPRI